MKTFLKIAAVMLLLISVPTLAQSKSVTIKTNINCDHCKQCPSCGGKFQKTLIKESGIQMVILDEQKMTLKVTYNSKKTDPQAIKVAISKLGYDADEIKADPKGFEQLDSCCKPG
ncbi:heavy metal-associated domain-containing protein [Flavobacterium sp.]|uniref:heavy-metal-associated domain-containing protein n=1 Tax=Flavobacterium sp. TaxID=239 RepID=UPI0011FBC6EF|nr:heavy metal-associated domain-containing protein [Flavobacterium sp.]RZJ71598.1 MAG: MerP protein [Flavobacterium sp.]